MTLTHVSNHHSSMSNHHGVKGGTGASVGFIHTENVHSSNNSFPHHQHNNSSSLHSNNLHSNNLVNSSNNHNNSKTHSSSMAPVHLHPSHRVSSSRNSSIHETSSNNSSSALHHRINHSSSLAHHNNHHPPGSNNHHNNSSSAHSRDVGMASETDLECGLGHEEWDDYPSDALLDTGEPGIPVRALYDYEGAEADELSFKQGRTKFSLFLLLHFSYPCFPSNGVGRNSLFLLHFSYP